MQIEFEARRRAPPPASRRKRWREGRRFAAMVAAVLLGVAAPSLPAAARPMSDLLSSFTPPTLAGNYLAGRYAGSSHDLGAAASYFQTALAMDPANPLLLERTFQLLVADGRIKDALPIAEKLVARDKGHTLGRLVLGVDALKKKQWERARFQFRQTTPRPLADLTVAVLSAWAQAGRGETDQALKTIDAISGLDWYAVFRNYHGALIAEQAGRKADALKRMTVAYEGDRHALRVVEAQIRLLARQKKTKEALEVVEEFEKQIPDHPVIEGLKEDILAGRTPAAIVATPQAGAAEFLYGLGSAMGRDGEDIAAMYLQLALWLTPDAEMPTIALAALQGQLKQYDKAIAILSHVPADSRLRPLADIQVGRYQTMMQNYEEASKHLEAVIARTPKDLEALTALGDVLRADKKFGEAAAAYTRAIDLIGTPTKGDWTLFYYRGIAFERTKQWPKAEADFDKALELQPDEPHVLNYLGYSWIDMGMNLDKGLALVKKAVELKSDDGYIVDSLGWAYYKLGRYDEAVKELERAILLKPDDPVINDHLGDAYLKVDRPLEATFQWRHALDMKPEPEEVPKIQKKLDEQKKLFVRAEEEAKVAAAAKAAAKAAEDAAAAAEAATKAAIASETAKAPAPTVPAGGDATAPATPVSPAAPAATPATPAPAPAPSGAPAPVKAE